jgi:FkbM family methyltransferase
MLNQSPLFGTSNSLLRRVALRMFRKINLGDITIRHHWTGDLFRLHSFKHKGYWWHGKKREQQTIERFRRLIRLGDTVIEVGGHVGYFSVLYAQLVGSRGRVFTFEPGDNNLPYIRRNLARHLNTEIIEKAVSDQNGFVKFWLEDLSGQNNSMVENYHLLDGNIALAGLGGDVHKREVQVPSITLDTFIEQILRQHLSPNFIKIDVEGAELLVLNGAKHLLSQCQIPLMVEVTCNAEPIFTLLREAGYCMYFENGEELTSAATMVGNIFCLPGLDWLERFNPQPKTQ